MTKLIGALLLATPITAGFVGIGLSPAGWGVAFTVFGMLAGITSAVIGIALITEPADHPWEELNR